MSEVDTCRERLAQFCLGTGLDLGFGGCQPIVPNAVCIDRPCGDPLRADYGGYQWPTQIEGDVSQLRWFANGQLDYVFSSHVLEDFVDTKMILKEWIRVLRPEGHLVLFLPDQVTYESCCRMAGTQPNQAHKHPNFNLTYVKECLASIGIGQSAVVHELFPVPNNDYSFDLVVKRPYSYYVK